MTDPPERNRSTGDEWRIRREITIDAPLETVWDCVGTPELVSRWWCPPPTVEIRFERRRGGDYEERYRDDDHQYDVTGTIVGFEPDRRFSVRRETGNRFGPADLIDVSLRPEDDCTTVTLDHSFERLPKSRREEATAFYSAGWSSSLDLLRDLATRFER